MILKLENTTTHQTYEYEVKDMNNGEKLYFRFDIDTSNLVDGEYTLKLYDGEKLVANDLLKIGDFNTNTIQYKKGENIYIEVKLDESVQDVKNISISTIETTVLPDDGFNSMGKVDVNAQPLYDNAYHIGHTEGYNEGLESSYQVGYDDGYSIGNEEGYNNGYNNGNADGIEEGKAVQKALLEPITITENGTYTKEDGYNSIEVNVPDLNGSYDEGYSDGYLMGEDKGYEKGYDDGIEEGTSNAGEIIAQTAQVINISENGYYLTKYADPYIPTDITGYFDDGTPFYDYTQLNNIVFDTKIKPNPSTKIEIWWNNTSINLNNVECFIFGTQAPTWKVMYSQHRNGYNGEINYSSTDVFSIPDIGWHHIIMSFEDGLVLDNNKIGNFKNNLTNEISQTIYINGSPLNTSFNINGYFGMIKIDDQILIPTAEGYKNYTTGELLEVVKEGKYEYTNNSPIYGEGNLIKRVNVNVPPLLNPFDIGLSFGFSTMTKLPEGLIDWSKVTDITNIFYYCSNLSDFSDMDLSNVKNMECAFYKTKINDETISKLNTSNVKNMNNAFYGCNNIINFPSINTSSVVNMGGLLESCSKIEEVAPIDTSNVTNMIRFLYDFSGEYPLRKLPEFDCTNVTNMSNYFAYSGYQNKRPKLTDCGGWKNLKCNWNDGYGLNHCPNLTYQSCINILNGLYDFTGNGETPSSNQGQLKVHQNFIDTVGDEISIGTNKGWTITT